RVRLIFSSLTSNSLLLRINVADTSQSGGDCTVHCLLTPRRDPLRLVSSPELSAEFLPAPKIFDHRPPHSSNLINSLVPSITPIDFSRQYHHPTRACPRKNLKKGGRPEPQTPRTNHMTLLSG